jgi:hypothetical protein
MNIRKIEVVFRDFKDISADEYIYGILNKIYNGKISFGMEELSSYKGLVVRMIGGVPTPDGYMVTYEIKEY